MRYLFDVRFLPGHSEEAVDFQCKVNYKKDAEVWLIQMPADVRSLLLLY